LGWASYRQNLLTHGFGCLTPGHLFAKLELLLVRSSHSRLTWAVLPWSFGLQPALPVQQPGSVAGNVLNTGGNIVQIDAQRQRQTHQRTMKVKGFDLYDSISVNADVPGSEGDSIAARPASTK